MATRPNPILEDLQRIKHELVAMQKMKIHIGIQSANGKNADGKSVSARDDILTIAGVHEYGATIKPKKAKNLAIPLTPAMKDKSPRDITDLFFIRSDGGFLFGVTKKGGNRYKNKTGPESLNFLFLLLPSVNIPERSFIRASYDTGKQTLDQISKAATDHVMFDGWTARQAMEWFGAQALQMTLDYFNNSSNFKPKSAITNNTTNQYQPLVDSGRLYHSITYYIEE